MRLCTHDLTKDCEGKYRNCIDCILNKIRADIETMPNANPSYTHTCDVVDREDLLGIIDKYKIDKFVR